MVSIKFCSSIAQSKCIQFHNEKQIRKKVPSVITIQGMKNKRGR